MENKNLTPEEIAKNRFDKLLRTIFYICDVAVFRIEGRITFVDKKTVKSKKRTVTLKGKKIKSKKKVYVRVRVKTKNGYTVWSNPKSVKVK